MKVVQFVEAFGGGVYTYVKDLCNFIVSNAQNSNIEVHLIYSPNRVELDKELFLKEIDPRVVLHELDMGREINLVDDFKFIPITRNYLKKIKPDVVHLHSSKASVIGRIACFGLIKRNKIFYSPHGYAFVQQNISNLKKNFYKSLETLMPAIFGGITVASGDTEYEVSKKISKAVLIRNGVDFQLPNKIFHPVENKRITVGTVGRLMLQKNPKAFNRIALQLPDIDFIWIGNGELLNDITAPNIKVTGWVKTRKELLEMLNSLDIYLQVSLWEGLPISILEAMAVRKPLIVSDVIGNRDTVEDNYNGFKFTTENEAVSYIKKLGQDAVLRANMGSKSYDKVYKEYNKNQNFSDLLKIYSN